MFYRKRKIWMIHHSLLRSAAARYSPYRLTRGITNRRLQVESVHMSDTLECIAGSRHLNIEETKHQLLWNEKTSQVQSIYTHSRAVVPRRYDCSKTRYSANHASLLRNVFRIRRRQTSKILRKKRRYLRQLRTLHWETPVRSLQSTVQQQDTVYIQRVQLVTTEHNT